MFVRSDDPVSGSRVVVAAARQMEAAIFGESQIRPTTSNKLAHQEQQLVLTSQLFELTPGEKKRANRERKAD